MPRRSALLLAALLVALASRSAPARQQFQGAEGPLIERGVGYLRSHVAGARTGEAAIGALAMVKCEVPVTDPVVLAAVAKVRERIRDGVYRPDDDTGGGTYEAAVATMLLANTDPITYKNDLEITTKFLVEHQLNAGCWDYRNREAGDTSVSQYALLGLWEAATAGLEVPPEAFDRASLWFLSKQAGEGSWNYHPDESNYPQTVAMTAAGAGSLLICEMQLQRHLKAMEPPSSLLTPLFPEGQVVYQPRVTTKALDSSIRRGVSWIASHLVVENAQVIGQSPYYALYGIERVAALSGKDQLGGADWYRIGLRYIQSSQARDGSWSSQHGVVPNTAWALMFLTKSTAKTVKKIEIKRLSAGTLLGGRGLPRDLSSLTVAGGRVMVRPMNGAIDGMLAVLEDPRSENAEAALSGMMDQYAAKGPAVLKPLKDRFRKLLTDPDPGNRSVAAWSLGRLGDLDVVPLLIKSIQQDPDDAVVQEARLSLQVLSRKIDGLGPPPNATPDQRAEAAQKWKAWFDSVRPPGLNLDEGDAITKGR